MQNSTFVKNRPITAQLTEPTMWATVEVLARTPSTYIEGMMKFVGLVGVKADAGWCGTMSRTLFIGPALALIGIPEALK